MLYAKYLHLAQQEYINMYFFYNLVVIEECVTPNLKHICLL